MTLQRLPECAICKKRGMWGTLRFYNDLHYLCHDCMEAMKDVYRKAVKLGHLSGEDNELTQPQ